MSKTDEPTNVDRKALGKTRRILGKLDTAEGKSDDVRWELGDHLVELFGPAPTVQESHRTKLENARASLTAGEGPSSTMKERPYEKIREHVDQIATESSRWTTPHIILLYRSATFFPVRKRDAEKSVATHIHLLSIQDDSARFDALERATSVKHAGKLVKAWRVANGKKVKPSARGRVFTMISTKLPTQTMTVKAIKRIAGDQKLMDQVAEWREYFDRLEEQVQEYQLTGNMEDVTGPGDAGNVFEPNERLSEFYGRPMAIVDGKTFDEEAWNGDVVPLGKSGMTVRKATKDEIEQRESPNSQEEALPLTSDAKGS